MKLKTLESISFNNCLNEKVSNVIILYCESNKSIHNWYNAGKVDVETLSNVLWSRYVSFDYKIVSELRVKTSGRNVCFGENFGYWQLYFSYEGDDYKLDKNDCKMTLTPECDQQELQIELSSLVNDDKDLDIKAKFQISTVSGEFKVVKGKPIVRGVHVCISNQLENNVDFINAVIVEENSSKKASQLNTVNVKFDNNVIKPSGQILSSEFVPYNCFGHKHYLKLYFTSQGCCYELENKEKYSHGIPLKLTEKEYGSQIEVVIVSRKQSVSIKVQNSSAKEFSLKKELISERRTKIEECVSKIRESSKLEDKMSFLIASLRNLSNNVYGRGDVTKKWLVACEESPKMFCRSGNKKADNNNDSNNYKEEMIEGRKTVKIANSLEKKLQDCKSTLDVVFSDLDSLRNELNNFDEILSPLKELLETIDSEGDNILCGITDDLKMVQSMLIVDVICKILIPSGLDENGLTFFTSDSENAREISVDPGKLASGIEEELNCFKTLRFARDFSMPTTETLLKKLVTHQNDLIRLTELFLLLREELIDCLRKISAELHFHTRNVNISMVASSSLGIVGAGFAVTGLVLAPFTAGVSLAMVATGVAVGATSSAVGVGTTIADGVLTKKCLDSTVSLAVNDHYVCNLLSNLQPVIKKETSLLQDSQMLSSLSETQEKFNFKVFDNVTDALSNVCVIALKTGVQVAKTAAFKIGSVVVGVIFDLTTLTLKSIKLSKGGCSELGFKIESDALLLEQELKDCNLKNLERLSSEKSMAEKKKISDYFSKIL